MRLFRLIRRWRWGTLDYRGFEFSEALIWLIFLRKDSTKTSSDSGSGLNQLLHIPSNDNIISIDPLRVDSSRILSSHLYVWHYNPPGLCMSFRGILYKYYCITSQRSRRTYQNIYTVLRAGSFLQKSLLGWISTI